MLKLYIPLSTNMVYPQNNKAFFKTKTMKYLIFIFGVITFSCNSCDPLGIKDKCERDYSFSIPVTLSPALDTFHVGDTIHISMEFPIEMEDKNSGEMYDMSDFNFNTEIGIAKIDTNPAIGGDPFVEYIEKVGKLNFVPLTGGGTAVFIEFEKSTSNFLFSCDIILNGEGLFALGYSSFFDDDFLEIIDESCKTTSIIMNYNLTPEGGDGDSNYEHLQYSLDLRHKNYSNEEFSAYGGFVFFVIE